MTISTSSANTTSVSTNKKQNKTNNTMLQTIFSTVANITIFLSLAEVKSALTESGLFNVERRKVVRVEKARVAGRKGKKHSKGHSKVKRTPVYETVTVVDVAAVNKFAKLVVAANKETAVEAAKAAFHARNNERAEAVAYQMAVEAEAVKLAHIEQQLNLVKSIKLRKVTVRKPVAVTKVVSTRTTVKPARLRVAQQPAVCFIGKLAPVAIPVRDVKVTREEAQALLAVANATPVARKAHHSTMSAIAAFNRVDSLVDRALLAISTGEAFVLAAQVRIANTINSLPAIAQTMTMSLDNNLTTIHNFVMNYMVDNGVSNYSQAVLEAYEDICIEQGIELTDELEDAILDMADRGIATGGGVNHDKNITVEVDSSATQTPVNTTNDSPATMLQNNINASTFASAKAFVYGDIPVSYDEVAPLVNFGKADDILNFDGNGTPFSEILCEMMFPTVKATVYPGDSEERRIEAQERADRKNARNAAAKEKFIAYFSNKLGYIQHITLEYTQGSSFDHATYQLRKHFLGLFTMAKLPLVKNGKIRYSGVEFDVHAPRFRVYEVSELWLAIIAKATFNITVEERAQLLGLLFNNIAKVDGSTISRDKISIDLANGIITTGNSREIRVNKASCFGTEGGFIVLDGLHALFLFALQALGGTSKQLETSINLAVKLFQPEHNYGHKPDHDDMAHFVRTNFVYTNAVKATSRKFPAIEIVGGKQNPHFLGWVLHRGVVATCDKTNIKFVTINAGAEAVGVGYTRDHLGRPDQMFTANDANKPTKLFNRAAANNYDCADMVDRVRSNFGFALSNGKVAYTKGKMMKVAYTNSILGAGSGTAIINLDSKFAFTISKKEKQPTNLSMFGYSAVNNTNFKKAFVAGVEKHIDELKGKIFGAGEVMLYVELGGKRYDLVSNTEEAADVTVTGGYVRNNVLDENSVEIVLEVNLVGNTGFVKTRRFATKFTTTPFKAEFVGLDNEWDIILNNECTKGHGALLEMFANATGERHLNNSTCMFTTPDGDSFDVRSKSNPFYDWRNANIKRDVTLTMSIAKSVWENIKRFCPDTVKAVAETTDLNGYKCVVVEETVDVIFGELVFDVEISSPLESVSKSNLTLESASAIYLQSARLGKILFNECEKKAGKFVKLASNFAGKDKADMHVVDLDNDSDFNSFITSLPACGDGALTQRQLVAAIAVKYPNGIKFFRGNKSVSINLGIVASFGQFNGLNGSAARETAEIVNFILDVMYNGASNSELMVNAGRAFNRIVTTAIDSKKVLKKPTRSGKLIYGKVRTAFHPMLNSEDGIPTIVMNINCPMVEMLGIPTDGSIVNYYVGFARTPMPFLGGARVRLTADTNICDVAHVLVDPYVWHQLNEGDSDGDGIACLNLSALGFTTDEIRELNGSIMGIAGYEHLYGKKVPFADFMSEEDKAGKKSFHGNINFMSTQVKDRTEQGESVMVDIVREFVGEFAALVADHYKSAVGTSYGICSKLVFQAADLATAGPSKELDTVLTACLIAWRSMYEGLGLSGYSPEADDVFNVLLLASNDVNTCKVHKNPDTGVISNAYRMPKSELVAGAKVLKELFGKDMAHIDLEVFHTIITSRCVTRMAVKLEGYGNLSNYWLETPGLEQAGIKYGALRRISQGDDRVAGDLQSFEDEAIEEQNGEYVGKPATRRFHERMIVENTFTNQLLGNVAAAVCEFHALLIETKQSLVGLDDQDS